VVRGVLDPVAAGRAFSLELRPPAADLADVVATHWLVRWDVEGEFVQDVLPHPAVNLVVEPGRPSVYGVSTRVFRRALTGSGEAVGTRLRPGALSAFSPVPACELADRAFAAADVLGPAGAELERAALAARTLDARIVAVEAWLRAHRGPLVPGAVLVGEAIDWMLVAPAWRTVPEVAGRFGVSVRTLQRLFRRYVGATPKWVLARYRVHEAAERLSRDPGLDLARLALDLGYADQAHFSADFRARTGRTPGAYAAAAAGR